MKLAGTEETALVHLQVDPKGESALHAHPGDELLLVLAGEIEVRLADSGMDTPLKTGDYAHFYAEQKHGVRNHGPQSAEVLVVRYYQLESLGTRPAFLDDLKKDEPSKNLLRRVREEMMTAVAPFTMRADSNNETRVVTDRHGLGRLLQLVCAANFQENGHR
jgi:uncharacterized cupin superfamily protein